MGIIDKGTGVRGKGFEMKNLARCTVVDSGSAEYWVTETDFSPPIFESMLARVVLCYLFVGISFSPVRSGPVRIEDFTKGFLGDSFF